MQFYGFGPEFVPEEVTGYRFVRPYLLSESLPISVITDWPVPSEVFQAISIQDVLPSRAENDFFLITRRN